ncbi:MAG: hypothetical protein U0271_05060 [Polyangiaceae bacterium]
MSALAAWDRGDLEALARSARELGATLDPASAAELDARITRLKAELKKPAIEGRRVVLEALSAAASSKNGFGWQRSSGGTALIALAVRLDGVVAIDLGATRGNAASPAAAWQELRPWRQAEHENVATVRAWAKKRARVQLALEQTESANASSASALERAAIAAPDDDEARAVLADALLAAGDPRGELVALGLRIAPFLVPSLSKSRLVAREETLLKALKSATPHALAYARSVRYRRGLIEEITVSGTVFEKHGQAMLSEAPVRSLRLAPNTPSTLGKLLATAALSSIRTLDLSDRSSTEEDLMSLASSPHLGSLEILDLGSTLIDLEGLAVLSTAPWAARLVGLRAALTSEAVATLVRAPTLFGALRRLSLQKSDRALARLLAARPIEVLSTGAASIPADELFANGAGEHLVWLRCDRTPERGHGVVSELARLSPPPRSLAALTLGSGARLSREELVSLASAPAFANLRYVRATLPTNPLDEELAARLLAHAHLRYVSLSENDTSMLSEATRTSMKRVGFPLSWPHSEVHTEAFFAPNTVMRAAEAMRGDELAAASPAEQLGRAPASRLEIAADRNAPAEALMALLDELRPDEIEVLVKNPSAPVSVLRELASASRKPALRHLNAIAAHPNADDALLCELATREHKHLRELVAEHPAASAETLRGLFEAGVDPAILAAHEALPRAVLDALLASSEPRVWQALAKRRALLTEDLRALVGKPDATTVALAIGRADATPDMLRAALDAWPNDSAIVCVIAAHDAAPEELASRLFDRARTAPKEAFALLEALARASAARSADLAWLASVQRNDATLALLAANPNTPEAILRDLARGFAEVVASNPGAPQSLIGELASESAALFAVAAANPRAPAELVERALVSTESEARRRAASNPALTTTRLAELAKSADEHVRAGVAENSACPADIARALALDPSPRVWLGLALNRACPTETLDLLARPEVVANKSVTTALAARISTKPLAGLAMTAVE